MRWVITGASRGIGLELTKQLLARGELVEAGARAPAASEGLSALAEKHGDTLRRHALDVADDEGVRAFSMGLAEGPIDVLVHSAGITGALKPLEEVEAEDLLRTFDVNAVGFLRVVRALLPRLGQGSKIVGITSGMGSLADNKGGGAYGYRMSKAALNMAVRSMAVDLRGRGIICAVLNPGWVKTDMGGPNATLPVETSASNLLRVTDALLPEQSGSFLDHTGRTWDF